MSQLFLLGTSHHTAPVEVRERVDFSRRGLAAALSALGERASAEEAVVLSTCNRSEVYIRCADPARAMTDLLGFMSEYHDIEREELAPHLYGLAGAAAVRHLFRVAAGLDSLVVGEPQILGQVKDAFALAADQQRTGMLLNRLFHTSFATGKRVRSETGLGEGAISVSYAAAALARKIFGDLSALSVLLIGAGEMAELTAMHLRSQRVERMAMASRTGSHAEALAAKVDGDAIAWDSIPVTLASSDIVVTATGSASPVLTTPTIREAMRVRRSRPLFIIDIGVPRDVEASAASLEQVFLYNIDDLQAIVTENLARRRSQIDRAEAIIAEEVEGFMAWLSSRGAVPTVVALRRHFEDVRQSELKRLAHKLAGLDPTARERVDEITRLLVERLLSVPTEQLKSAADHATITTYAETLNRLFSLDRPAKKTRGANDVPRAKTSVSR